MGMESAKTLKADQCEVAIHAVGSWFARRETVERNVGGTGMTKWCHLDLRH